MAVRNNTANNLWQRIRQDSVSWGSLALWILGLVVVLVMISMYVKT